MHVVKRHDVRITDTVAEGSQQAAVKNESGKFNFLHTSKLVKTGFLLPSLPNDAPDVCVSSSWILNRRKEKLRKKEELGPVPPGGGIEIGPDKGSFQI